MKNNIIISVLLASSYYSVVLPGKQISGAMQQVMAFYKGSNIERGELTRIYDFYERVTTSSTNNVEGIMNIIQNPDEMKTIINRAYKKNKFKKHGILSPSYIPSQLLAKLKAWKKGATHVSNIENQRLIIAIITTLPEAIQRKIAKYIRVASLEE